MKRRIIIASAVSAAALLTIAIGVAIHNHHQTNSLQYESTGLLRDGQQVSIHDLPSAQTIFYTMLNRTARQQIIAGLYAEGTYGSAGLQTSAYQLRSLQWSTSGYTFAYQEEPTSDSVGNGLVSCVDGLRYTNISGHWGSASEDSFCKPSASGSGIYNTIDNLVTGGLSKTQANAWTTALAGATDSRNRHPVLTFGEPQIVTKDSKKLIQLAVSVQQINNPKYCGGVLCGLGVLSQSLAAAIQKPTASSHGYEQSGSWQDTQRGQYLIDPVSLLPVESSNTVVKSNKPAYEFRKLFSFKTPDFAAARQITTPPAQTDELLRGMQPADY